jgi:uncharacterized protein YxeA
MKKILTVLVVLLTLVAFSSGVMAQAPAKPAAPAATDKPKVESPKAEKKEAPQTTEVSGTVAAYEAGKTIKVKGQDKEMTFEITGDTKVNGEVKVGAKATVMYKKVGDKMIATAITIATEKKS